MAARRWAIVAALSAAAWSVWLACCRIRSVVHTLALALVALVVACGGGDGEDGATLTVTRDFGLVVLDSAEVANLPDGATALTLLRDQTNRGAGGEGWTVFVNGVRPDVPAGEAELAGGDTVLWDRHPRDAAPAPTRAIVGAFPDPFLHGLEGRRRPVRVECDDADSAPCEDAKQALQDVGVPTSGSSIGAPGTENVTRLVVALWPAARIVRGAHTLEQGPEQSGVYARFANGGLELLDEHGQVARRAAPGTGLIAALRPRADELVWLVTALDREGLAAGVRALRARALRNAYAVAATGDTVQRLPL
jgi:Domain of unknown function (DUF4430)